LQLSMPFGASASVRNFLTVSSFLQVAGCALGLLWTSYFDDFPTISHAMHTSSTLACGKASCLFLVLCIRRRSWPLSTTLLRSLVLLWT
jgi:hypothetical protein